MNFVYQFGSHAGFDPERQVTVHWGGGGGGAGNGRRSFRFDHPDWSCTQNFYYEELDIAHLYEFGNLTLNEVSVTTTYGIDPRVWLHPFGSVENKGPLPEPGTLWSIKREAIACLYSRGGREPVRILRPTSGLERAR